MNPMAKVVLYSKDPCPYCVAAKKFLQAREIAFEEIDLTGDFAGMDAVKEKTGWRTFPIILINDKVVGGFTDLKGLDERGELEAMVNS